MLSEVGINIILLDLKYLHTLKQISGKFQVFFMSLVQFQEIIHLVPILAVSRMGYWNACLCVQEGKGISLWCKYTIEYFLTTFTKVLKITSLPKRRQKLFTNIPVLLFCGKFGWASFLQFPLLLFSDSH